MIYLGTCQQIHHPDNGIQRRSQLVTYGTNELTLGEICAIRLIQCGEEAANEQIKLHRDQQGSKPQPDR